MTRAIEAAAQKRKGLNKLLAFVEGSSAFAFTDKTPFELNDMFRKNKAKASAKAGTVAPEDILIMAGNTGFPPGPLITELSQVGLKTRIQGGSIWITKDHVLVKAGEIVTRPQALVLSRLGMEPYEIFLRLTAAYDDGIILTGDIFDISFGDVFNQLQGAAQSSLALAFAIGYVSIETLQPLLQQAYAAAQSLGLKMVYLSDELVPTILARAEQQASGLAQLVRAKNSDAMPN